MCCNIDIWDECGFKYIRVVSGVISVHLHPDTLMTIQPGVLVRQKWLKPMCFSSSRTTVGRTSNWLTSWWGNLEAPFSPCPRPSGTGAHESRPFTLLTRYRKRLKSASWLNHTHTYTFRRPSLIVQRHVTRGKIQLMIQRYTSNTTITTTSWSPHHHLHIITHHYHITITITITTPPPPLSLTTTSPYHHQDHHALHYHNTSCPHLSSITTP